MTAKVYDLALHRRVRQEVDREVARAHGVLQRCRKPDGTYDLSEVMSEMTGLDRAEVAWTARRMHQLLAAGWSKEQTLGVIQKERKSQPWRGSQR